MRRAIRLIVAAVMLASAGRVAGAQEAAKPYEPTVGQTGKDVVWVPTPDSMVEKMLDLAAVTPKDVVMDLGSGDGRMVVAAAKRGARALGVEYNEDMVALSKRRAADAGVADKATFVQGDMYEADISQATVLALFLLPANLDRLAPKFLALKPGTRIVLNTFGVSGWNADVTERLEGDCNSWCTAMLLIVPAQVAGTWRLDKGELTLAQEFQTISGTLTSAGTASPIESGRMHGDEIEFSIGGEKYTGRVKGDAIDGTIRSGSSQRAWKAVRVSK